MTGVKRFLYRWLNRILVRSYNALRRFRPLEMAMDLAASKLFPNIGIPLLESARSTGSMEQD